MHERTTSAEWVRSIVDLLLEAGLDVAAVFEEAEADLSIVEDPHGRYSTDKLSRIWEVAAARSGNPAIGVAMPRGAKPANLNVLTYAMMSCPDLLTALERLVQYLRIVSNAAVITIQEDCAGTWMTIDLQGGRYPVPRQRFEFILVTLLRFCRWITGRQLKPLAVDLAYPLPADLQPYKEAFQCPLHFGAPIHRMLFSFADLTRALPTSHPMLSEMHEKYAGEYLHRLDNDRTTHCARELIMCRLPYGEPLRKDVADALCMSERTLQRRLQQEGTSFQQVVDDTRRELARQYLCQDDLSVTQATYLLGFSDQSTFFRACKRWFDMPPGQYRAKLNARTRRTG
jgi:AraC-like DNA-binding protein